MNAIRVYEHQQTYINFLKRNEIDTSSLESILAQIWGFDDWESIQEHVKNPDDTRVQMIDAITKEKERYSMLEWLWYDECKSSFDYHVKFEEVSCDSFNTLFCIRDGLWQMVDPWLIDLDGTQERTFDETRSLDEQFSFIQRLVSQMPSEWLIDDKTERIILGLVKQGHSESAYFLGKLKLRLKDPEGIRYLEQASDGGIVEASYDLVSLLESLDNDDQILCDRIGFTEEEKSILKEHYLKTAADQGHAISCYRYYTECCTESVEKGLPYLLSAYEQMLPEAAYQLAIYKQSVFPLNALSIFIRMAKEFTPSELNEVDIQFSLTSPGRPFFNIDYFRKHFKGLNEQETLEACVLLTDSGLVGRSVDMLISEDNMGILAKEYLANQDGQLSGKVLLERYATLTKFQKMMVTEFITSLNNQNSFSE
jgi:hypothetical protein